MKIKTTLAAAALLLAHAAIAQDLPSGYTCCNLHYDKDRISDVNWTHAPMIPAGAKIRVLGYGTNEANVEIDDRPYVIAHEYGRKQESVEQFVKKLVVPASPKAKIASWPPPVRSAIEKGTVVNGMTREQVIVSVGYPPTHRTPTLDAPMWQHWQSRAGRFEVYWGADGKVERTVGVKDKP
jgi:hypothetical protein